MKNKCKDCRFYLPVDVFKGICKAEKTKIGPDDLACPKYERLAKCKFCGKYKSDSEYLGSCLGHTVAYPDMNATKCAGFEWVRQN